MNTFQIIHLYLNKLTRNSYLNQSKSNSYLGASALPLVIFLRIAAVGFAGPRGFLGTWSPGRASGKKGNDLLLCSFPIVSYREIQIMVVGL